MIMLHIKNVEIFSHAALFFPTEKMFQRKVTELTTYMPFFNLLGQYSILNSFLWMVRVELFSPNEYPAA